MLLHTAPLFAIYFGDASDQVHPDFLKANPDGVKTLSLEPLARLKKALNIESLMFLHQVHGVQGLAVTPDNQKAVMPFFQDGDFLITNTKGGIGVLTGDCLPIVIHDNFANVVAVVHAGWRGSVEGVAIKALEQMKEQFGTTLDHVRVLFGPSAKSCCYQVSDDFIKELEGYSWAAKTIVQHNGHLYFDLPGFNRLMLEEYGIKKDAIGLEYNVCTICNPSFCSHRRDKTPLRHMTVVCLK